MRHGCLDRALHSLHRKTFMFRALYMTCCNGQTTLKPNPILPSRWKALRKGETFGATAKVSLIFRAEALVTSQRRSLSLSYVDDSIALSPPRFERRTSPTTIPRLPPRAPPRSQARPLPRHPLRPPPRPEPRHTHSTFLSLDHNSQHRPKPHSRLSPNHN